MAQKNTPSDKPRIFRGAVVRPPKNPQLLPKAAEGAEPPVAKPVEPVVAKSAATVEQQHSNKAQRHADDKRSRDLWYAQHQAGVSHKRFWFVWSPTERRPSMRHESLRRAVDAAERLRLVNPSREFLVYEATLVQLPPKDSGR